MRIAVAGLFLGATLAAQNPACIRLGQFAAVGRLPTNLQPGKLLHEASGMEASRINPGVLWVHDDAATINQIVAMDASGKVVQTYRIGKLTHGDWEDIAIGQGPIAGRDYIYIADTGNNELDYSSFSLIRFPEPLTPARPTTTILIEDFQIFSFRYPHQVHDAETLLIDPIDGRPYLLTKEAKSAKTAYLYGYPLPLDAQNIKTLERVTIFRHKEPRFSGGDVSSDGRWVLARTNDRIYAFRRGAPSAPFVSAFTNLVCEFTTRKQGNAEALTISANGREVYTTAEGERAPIWRSSVQLPRGTIAFPAWWCFGSYTSAGTSGPAGLTLDTCPALGRRVTATIWDARPQARAAIGFSGTALPDGHTRFGGGWAHVAPRVVFLLTTDEHGNARLPLGVPQGANLIGVRVHAQAAIENLPRRSLTLTRGLTLQIGRD